MIPVRRTLHAAILALLALCSCAAPAAPPHLLLITIDTLRLDRLGCYGSTRGLTPFLDSLAERGYLFANGYAQSSWTNPAIASVLTSRYVSQHGVTAYESVVAAAEQTLPEILQAQGYYTGGFSGNLLIHAGAGFAQGFDKFEVVIGPEAVRPGGAIKPRAEAITRAGLAWLDSLPRDGGERAPVFLFLHYMEPHPPLLPPRETIDLLLDRRGRAEVVRQSARAMLENPERWEQIAPQSVVRASLVQDLYDAEIMHLDEQLRVLFAQLEDRGMLADTVVVITADHGEEFGDHGQFGHGKTLFNEVVHVPFLLLVPSTRAGAKPAAVVSHIDVAPTLADFAGIAPPASFEGQSLRRLLAGEGPIWRRALRRLLPGSPANGHAAYSELIRNEDPARRATSKRHERALVSGAYKLIVTAGGSQEAYDLNTDPAEKHPAAIAAQERAELQQSIARMAQRLQRNQLRERVGELDEQARERLRALGYGTDAGE